MHVTTERSSHAPALAPRLLADIGATYARFASRRAPGSFSTSPCCAAPTTADFNAAGARLPGDACRSARIEHAAVAIANPVDGDQVRMTNHDWQFSIEQMRQRLRA